MKNLYKIKVQHENKDFYVIANHSSYIKWIESAKNEFFEENGVYFKHLKDIGVKVLVTEMVSKYKKPVFLMNELSIFTRILKLKKHCIELESIINNANDEIIFKSELKAIFTAIHNKPPTRIPDYIYLSLSESKESNIECCSV